MSRRPPVKPGDPLTHRELQVLHLTALGARNAGTARHLWISLDTVKTHLRSCSTKLGAHDRSHLVALAFAHGYLWVDPTGTVRATLPLHLLQAAAAA